jgi:hypothetical protein
VIVVCIARIWGLYFKMTGDCDTVGDDAGRNDRLNDGRRPTIEKMSILHKLRNLLVEEDMLKTHKSVRSLK